MPRFLARAARPVSGERLVVVWRVTTRCNLSCGFCAYDRRLSIPRSEIDEPAARRVALCLAAHSAHTGRRVHLSLLGGEPLLWRPLANVAADFAELGLSLGITTNGTALSAASAQQLLLEHFDEVTVSVDGLAETHDRLRGWVGGFAQLERSLRTLAEAKKARGRGPVLRVNTVLMRDNVAGLAELGRMLADWGVEELTFNRLGERDRPEFFEQHRLGPGALERLARLLPALRVELAQRGLQLRGSDGYVRRLLELERGLPTGGSLCDPGAEFLFLDERGRFAPCSFTLDDLGEPWPNNQRGLAGLSKRFLLQQSAGAVACRDCRSTQVAGKFREADGP